MGAALRSCALQSMAVIPPTSNACFARIDGDLNVAAKPPSARFARMVPNRPLVAAASI